MKIDRLQQLNEEISVEMSSHGVGLSMHYREKDKWCSLDDTSPSSSLILDLDKAKSFEIAFHPTSSLTAHFFLPYYNAVASLTFSKSPRKEKQKSFRKIIDRIQENALNAYRVSHHHLTNLLTKDAFRDGLRSFLAQADEEATDNFDTQESARPTLVAVLAFDIDHFKQVNDTWGHLYGDQVLKAFGNRLDSCAQAVEHSGEQIKVHVGHPSGEEFLVCISAKASREQFFAWADNFRLSIFEHELPTNMEWNWLSSEDDLSMLTPPRISERKISTSIGLALNTSIIKPPSSNDISATMLDNADTALFRAKAAGRNQVIFYDEILTSCGRVLEHESKTGVIAIDIGSNVGVTNGQEFRVYHPTFTGTKKFSVNDGRTTRTLGVYPKVESGRIVIFDAQAEVSFGFIEPSESNPQTIEQGSHLEAIPAGSIGHLLSNASRYVTSSTEAFSNEDIHTLHLSAKKLAIEEQCPFAVVIRFTQETDYLKKFGTSALNKALAKLYRGAQNLLSTSSKIAVLDIGSICVVGSEAHYKEKELQAFISDINNELPALDIVSGVCCHADFERIYNVEKIKIDHSHAIELARFAASDAGKSAEDRVNHFTLEVAIKLLKSQYKSHSFSSGYTDYERLIEIGVTSATINNMGGVLASQCGNPIAAFDHFLAASIQDPLTHTYKTNVGTIAFRLNDIEGGLKVLNTLTTKQLQRAKSKSPYGIFCYAALLAMAKNSNSLLYDEKKFNSIAADALKTDEAKQFPQKAKLIQSELDRLANSTK